MPTPAPARQGLKKHEGRGREWRALCLLSEEEAGPEACVGRHPNSVTHAQGRRVGGLPARLTFAMSILVRASSSQASLAASPRWSRTNPACLFLEALRGCPTR